MDIFDGANYIKASEVLEKETSLHEHAPLFRKTFTIREVEQTTLYVQALGYGVFYVNGKPITQDLLISPVSNYNKVLWYNVYDVTPFLQKGVNVICAILGNGFYNEGIDTVWKHCDASWRDVPKFILKMTVEGKTIVVSDDSWFCNTTSFIEYNQLRAGEKFNATRYDAEWTEVSYEDDSWQRAILDHNRPTGNFLECKCPPIRESASYAPTSVKQLAQDRYIYDFGVNISGYARVRVQGEKGQRIQLRYAEEVTEAGELALNNLDCYYTNVEFQTDTLVLSGGEDCYQPYFTYHGFRYIEVCGISHPIDIQAVFIHQQMKKNADFVCGDTFLNTVYQAGMRSILSNAHYTFTDCPTREKLGWLNDMQATVKTCLYNFDSISLYEKILTDLHYEIDEDGAFPAIIPSHGWGKHHGPAAEGFLFEVPYRYYLMTGDKRLLQEYLPDFYRYLPYLKNRILKKDKYVLGDWLGFKNAPTPIDFIERVYLCRLLEVIALSEQANENSDRYKNAIAERESVVEALKKEYYNADGTCKIEEQTALAMTLLFGISHADAIKHQLIRRVEQDAFQNKCGMIGTQFIYDALTMCGRPEYAYKLLTKTEIGYQLWVKHNATTLWETWDGVHNGSHNHHMYSSCIGWMMESLLGIMFDGASDRILLRPQFIKKIGFVEGYVGLLHGRVTSRWEHTETGIRYTVEIPNGYTAEYHGQILQAGKYEFWE